MKYKSGSAFRRALEDRLRSTSLQTGAPLVRPRKMIAFEWFLACLLKQQPEKWILKGGYSLQLCLGSSLLLVVLDNGADGNDNDDDGDEDDVNNGDYYGDEGENNDDDYGDEGENNDDNYGDEGDNNDDGDDDDEDKFVSVILGNVKSMP